MKALSVGMQAQLDSPVSTIAMCVKIERKDGTTLRYTSYSRDLTIGVELYKASNSFEVSSINITNRLSSDNFDISGVLTAIGVTEEDIRIGKYDDAKVTFFTVNYKDPNEGQDVITTGNIGEITFTEYDFIAEYRSISSKLTQKIGSLYSRSCRATLGDAQCGVNLSNYTDTYTVGGVYPLPIKYFRMTMTAYNGSDITISDLILYDNNGNRIVDENDTYSATINGVPGQIISELFDNDVATNCLVTVIVHNNQPVIIDYEFSETKIFNYYNILSCHSTRTPSAWTLDVSINGIDYYTVDTQTNILPENWDDPSAPPYTDYTLNSRNNFPLVDTRRRSYLYIEEDPGQDDDWYKYGKIEWLTGNNAGVINDISGYTAASRRVDLFLQTPYNIYTGDTFNITAGCNKLLIGSDGTVNTGHCKAKFNNVINFRGEPYLPTEDKLMTRGEN